MIKSIINALKQQGYKITSQRIEIIKTLTSMADGHPTLNELFEEVKKTLTRISYSTLYDNLQKLESLDILRFFTLQGETHIEMNTKPHLNIVKRNTGEIIDVNDPILVKDILGRLNVNAENYKFTLVNVLLDD
ncbi:MAG: transcriptional repressor [Asgard group archaeon]|nr:transcriptional repressor [Asgard group archaeon]